MVTIRPLYLLLFLLFYADFSFAQQNCSFKVGSLKYGGGGDWYANPTSLPDLFRFIRSETRMDICLDQEVVEPGSPQLFQYPMVYMTGHGNVKFTDAEVENLRKYMLGGGFLLADDNYGMQKYIRRELERIFPDLPLLPIPANHPIFNQHFKFPNGMPKIHEHDGKPAQGFGIVYKNRLVCILTYETDLGDGWEDPSVHHDPEAIRLMALQMGANIVQYVVEH